MDGGWGYEIGPTVPPLRLPGESATLGKTFRSPGLDLCLFTGHRTHHPSTEFPPLRIHIFVHERTRPSSLPLTGVPHTLSDPHTLYPMPTLSLEVPHTSHTHTHTLTEQSIHTHLRANTLSTHTFYPHTLTPKTSHPIHTTPMYILPNSRTPFDVHTRTSPSVRTPFHILTHTHIPDTSILPHQVHTPTLGQRT